MGKKPKSKSGKEKANSRKVDKSTLPPPPAPVSQELGSAKLLDEPRHPGSIHKALDREGYDDGGVADLTLVIDLEDNVMRRRRGETDYFHALKANLLPRVTTGQLAHESRREQKIRLAKMLFSDEETEEEGTPSEVYVDNVDGKEDEATMKKRMERLKAAKFALFLSSVLREPACSSLSLAEICKRYLGLRGKDGAEDALRCATKAVEIASEGFYDNDLIAMEAEDEPKINPKHEANATYPGLSNPISLKLLPKRVSELCLRSSYLHQGNALMALDRVVEARESYQKGLPMLDSEPRCGRLDWERSSFIVNIANSYAREGNLEKAFQQYDIAEKLGKDHMESDRGSPVDGLGMMMTSMRFRAFALKKCGKEDEAKKQMSEVIRLTMKLKEEEKTQEEKARILNEKEIEKEAHQLEPVITMT